MRDSEDAWPILREFAYNAHRGPDRARWSFHRDLGNTGLLMIDSRGGRVLQEDKCSIVDAEEWAWSYEKATGGFDPLLIGTSLPLLLLLGPGMHHLQSWDERLCSGAWGAARRAETFRRSQDLDHRGFFHNSFAAMVRLIRDVASGKKGDPPPTILILSGDVHHGYLAEATFDNSTKSHVYQAVCSPLRNALPREESFLQNNAWTGLAVLAGRFLASLARIPHEPISWRMTHDAAFFENQIAPSNSTTGAPRPRSRKPSSMPRRNQPWRNATGTAWGSAVCAKPRRQPSAFRSCRLLSAESSLTGSTPSRSPAPLQRQVARSAGQGSP